MPASSDIYGQIQPPRPTNRLADLAQAMQIQGLQSQQELGQYTLKKAQREDEEISGLNSAYSGALDPATGKVDRTKLFTLLTQGNLGSRIPGIQEGFAKQDKAATDADAAKFDLAKKRHDLFKQTLGALAQEPNLTKDLVLQAGHGLVQQSILPAEMYQQAMASMPDDPVQLRARLTQGLKSQMTPQQIFEVFSPKPTEVTNGQQKSFRDTNPNSPTYGQTTAGAPVQMQATPGEVLTDQRTRAEGALNRGVTIRGQDLTNQRSIDANNTEAGKRQQAGVIELRKEFNGLPEVKNYKEVLPIIQSVSRAPDTPAGDIDLIYGVGKVMDPNSVVREGEMAIVIKSGSPAQRLQGLANYVQGGGRLSPQQRSELLAVMNSRVQGLKSNYDAALKTFGTAADRQGLPREQVFIESPEVPALPPTDLSALPTGKPGRRDKPPQAPKVVNFGDLK